MGIALRHSLRQHILGHACVVYEKHLNFVAARQRFDFFPTNSSKLRKYWIEPTGEGYFRVTK
jgi:hypothetical protein